MSLLQLPQARPASLPQALQWDAPSQALERWAGGPAPQAATDEGTISILDPIGADWFGDGVTAKRISAALRSIGANPVTVTINSPGGDMFEGLTIYNLLREHKAKVTVRVLGLAASAASVIAMAGDEIIMSQSSFLMIHNAWGVVIGDSNDMARAAETFAQFNGAMGEIYAARSGKPLKDVSALMDAETFIVADDAVAMGFATAVDSAAPEASASAAGLPSDIAARRRIESMLARGGVPRSERRKLIGEIAGMRTAAAPATHDAGFAAAAERLLATLKI